MSNGVVSIHERVSIPALNSNGRISRTSVNFSSSIKDGKSHSQCDTKFGPHFVNSNGIIKSTSSSVHTGKSVEPLTAKPCVTLLDSNPLNSSINCINKCKFCVSNCSFACTNGSKFQRLWVHSSPTT